MMYTYDVYIQRDIFVYKQVLYMYLIDICVVNYWDFLKLECIYLKSLNLLSHWICKAWSTKFTHMWVLFPLVHLGDTS